MKIAVCSQNRKTVTGHAGRCRRFRIFVCEGERIEEEPMLELGIDETFHATRGNETHALDKVDALIAKDMGDGLKRKLENRNIDWWLTEISDPAEAVKAYLQRT